ncbi:MAG: FecR domain-containing protein [Bacteroidetes bacterium]|nr:FecR domain-containing protein [Bacteroidota bacterium]
MKENIENIDYILLISRHLDAEASPEEQKLLKDWIDTGAENRKLYESYRKTWEQINKLDQYIPLNIDDEWNRMASKMEATLSVPKTIQMVTEKRNPMPGRILKIAAIFIFALMTSVGVFLFYNSQQVHLVADSVNETLLPDGTSVTLNANSSLKYIRNFKVRTVTFNGEGYFKVQRDESKTFKINADELIVEVLGTSFYVNTNADSGRIVVIVSDGKVAVYQREQVDKRLELTPGNKGVFSRITNKLEKTINTDLNFLSWKTKKLVFDNTELSKVVKTLNKFFDSDIRIISKEIENCPVNTTCEENPRLDAILKRIQAALDLQVVRNGNIIELSGKSCSQKTPTAE